MNSKMSILNLLVGYVRFRQNYDRLMWFVRESFIPFFAHQLNPEYYRPIYGFVL